MNDFIERIQNTHGESRIHGRLNFLPCHPTNFARFGSGVSVPIGRTATVNESNYPLVEVLVHAGETLHLYLQPGFFADFTPNAVLEGFVQFEHSTGGFPAAVVVSPDHENSIVVPYDDAGDT